MSLRLCVLLWPRPNAAAALIEYEDRVLDLVSQHAGRVLQRARTDGGAHLQSNVSDEHGWRIGRLKDPFGHEWEIGSPLGAWPPMRS